SSFSDPNKLSQGDKSGLTITFRIGFRRHLSRTARMLSAVMLIRCRLWRRRFGLDLQLRRNRLTI
ncbi:hypothetical protein L9F63_020388, partial [Diploptera punctata]